MPSADRSECPLETTRLHLRLWRIEDAPGAFHIYSDPQVMHFLGGPTPGSGAPVRSLDEMRERLKKMIDRTDSFAPGLGMWATFEKSTGQLVGCMLLKPLPGPNNEGYADEIEVGWHLARSAWGKGFATEGGRAMLRHAFNTLHVPIVYAVVYPENARSVAVMHRLQMRGQGITERFYNARLELFALERSAWHADECRQSARGA